jgi:hypothetical protein
MNPTHTQTFGYSQAGCRKLPGTHRKSAGAFGKLAGERRKSAGTSGKSGVECRHFNPCFGLLQRPAVMFDTQFIPKWTALPKLSVANSARILTADVLLKN